MEAIHAIHPHAVPLVAGREPELDNTLRAGQYQDQKEHTMTEIDRTCWANETETSYAVSSRLGRGYDGCTTFAGTS